MYTVNESQKEDLTDNNNNNNNNNNNDGPLSGKSGLAGTRNVKSVWIYWSDSGISWVIYKSAPRSRQITTPAPNQSVFCRPAAIPAAQPTASKHWRKTDLTD